MSIVLELEAAGQKAGRICNRDYRKGDGCPLIVRQTSEDVLTANVFGTLRNLRPSLWLDPVLAYAFPNQRLPACEGSELQVGFWRSLEPPSNRKGKEGPTEPDVLFSFRGILILVEAKYGSAFAARTSLDARRDQVIRLIDVAYSHAVGEQLFQRAPYVLVVGAWMQEPPLVTRYRQPAGIIEALTTSYSPAEAARVANFMKDRIGYVSWRKIAAVLMRSLERGTPTEAAFLLDTAKYLLHRINRRAGPCSPIQ